MRLSRSATTRALRSLNENEPEETKVRYVVQVGRMKGTYETKYSFPTNKVGTALKYYHSVNIGNGYKKRIVDLESGQILDRQFS